MTVLLWTANSAKSVSRTALFQESFSGVDRSALNHAMRLLEECE